MNKGYYTRGCFVFVSANAHPGMDTIAVPNHCLLIMQYKFGVVYYNWSLPGVVSSFKFDEGLYSGFQKSNPERGFEFGSPLPSKNFSNFNLSRNEQHTLNVPLQPPTFKNLTNPHALSILFAQVRFSDLPYSAPIKGMYTLDPVKHDPFYLETLNKVIKRLDPITAIDVGVYGAPSETMLKYGYPLICQNFCIHMMMLEVGNVLTPSHLRHRLINWNGKTNFFSNVIYDRPVKDSEIAI